MLRGTAQNPDTFFQAREACEPLLRGLPGRSCARRWRTSPRCTGRQLRPVRLRRSSRGRARDRDDGLGRRDRAGDGRAHGGRAARRSASSRCACSIPSRWPTSWPPCPTTVRALAVLDRTKEPGAVGDPLYLEVAGRAAGGGRRRAHRASTGAAGGGRPLRPLVEGVRPAHGQGGLRRTSRERSPRNHFTVGIMDDVTHPRSPGRSHLRHRAGRREAGGLLRPGRRRHGGRQQELDQDHRRGDAASSPRATSSTTRRSRAPPPSRTCASDRGPSARPT